LVTPTRREPRESATEKTPPGKRRNAETQKRRNLAGAVSAFCVFVFLRFPGKGEMVR